MKIQHDISRSIRSTGFSPWDWICFQNAAESRRNGPLRQPDLAAGKCREDEPCPYPAPRVAKGENTKQIAGILTISPKTVEYHRLKMMTGLDLHDIAGLVRFALRVGLIPADG